MQKLLEGLRGQQQSSGGAGGTEGWQELHPLCSAPPEKVDGGAEEGLRPPRLQREGGLAGRTTSEEGRTDQGKETDGHVGTELKGLGDTDSMLLVGICFPSPEFQRQICAGEERVGGWEGGSPTRGSPRDGTTAQVSHTEPPRDWLCREPKKRSGTLAASTGDLGVVKAVHEGGHEGPSIPETHALSQKRCPWGKKGVGAAPVAGSRGLCPSHPTAVKVALGPTRRGAG